MNNGKIQADLTIKAIHAEHGGYSFQFIQRIGNEDIDVAKLNLASDTRVVVDVQGHYYLLFTGQWSIKWALDNNAGLQLLDFDHM
jgi:hypothetical protein